VVLDGTAMASVLGPAGTRQTVGRIEAGGTFGEMALMTKVIEYITDQPGANLFGSGR
jgi:CRP-like cAMP-binding protein